MLEILGNGWVDDIAKRESFSIHRTIRAGIKKAPVLEPGLKGSLNRKVSKGPEETT